jgi:hypothetical protein
VGLNSPLIPCLSTLLSSHLISSHASYSTLSPPFLSPRHTRHPHLPHLSPRSPRSSQPIYFSLYSALLSRYNITTITNRRIQPGPVFPSSHTLSPFLSRSIICSQRRAQPEEPSPNNPVRKAQSEESTPKSTVQRPHPQEPSQPTNQPTNQPHLLLTAHSAPQDQTSATDSKNPAYSAVLILPVLLLPVLRLPVLLLQPHFLELEQN